MRAPTRTRTGRAALILGPSLLVLLLAVPLAAASSVTTRPLPPKRLTVGDRFDVLLTVTGPESSKVIGPFADSLGVFLVTGQKSKTAVRARQAETVYRLSLAAFQAGKHRLPVFTFLIGSGQRTDTLRSQAAPVTVASVLPPKMKDINDLKRAEAFPNYWLWIIPGIVLLAAALAYAGYRIYRRILRLRELAAAPLPPWEQALAALDGMPWREWLDAGQIKRYYYALSEILKRYIERRFEFNAVEQTTTEILASMRVRRTPMRDEVGRFLVRADFVKYAKTVPPPEEIRSAIDQVRDFVVQTRPAEPAPEVTSSDAVDPQPSAKTAQGGA